MIIIDSLPGLGDENTWITQCVIGTSAILASPTFLARICLETGVVRWLIERDVPVVAMSAGPVRVVVSEFCNKVLWVDAAESVVVDLRPSQDGGCTLTAHCFLSGRPLWVRNFSVPESAEWAESTPAWPGAPTEEIDAFLADSQNCLVLCMSRQTRRSRLSSPSRNIHCTYLPPYRCQLDAARIDPQTGTTIWANEYRDVHVGIIERRCFRGIWACASRAGRLDFETGANQILYEYDATLGWPVRHDSRIAISWHNHRDVGVDSFDDNGTRICVARLRRPKVKLTMLHSVGAGLALQINDQGLCWLGQGAEALWEARCKPYIYRVYRGTNGDVFVGTDGNGGRLFGFDSATGEEILNLKPSSGGFGSLVAVKELGLLVTPFSAKPRHGGLLILNTSNRSQHMIPGVYALIGQWNRGVVCRYGAKLDQLAIIDLASHQV